MKWLINGLSTENAGDGIIILKYLNCMIPHLRVLSDIYRRLPEMKPFQRNTNKAVKPRIVKTPSMNETVSNEIKNHPETSSSKIRRNLNICHQIVWHILHDFQIFFYHI